VAQRAVVELDQVLVALKAAEARKAGLVVLHGQLVTMWSLAASSRYGHRAA